MKTIRATYPLEFSVGLLILIFVLSFFLSSQLFDVPWRDLIDGSDINAYVGMSLISIAVVIMVLILWEEFLFPIKVRRIAGGVTFRNRRKKLRTQLLIYCIIPAIFIYVYLNYQIHPIRFLIWAAICIIVPLVTKLFSGINNYNDFLKLTDKTIEFKNNKKSGVFKVTNIQRIRLVREHDALIKIEVTTGGQSHVIDLDEMELDVFLDTINDFVSSQYKSLLA